MRSSRAILSPEGETPVNFDTEQKLLNIVLIELFDAKAKAVEKMRADTKETIKCISKCYEKGIISTEEYSTLVRLLQTGKFAEYTEYCEDLNAVNEGIQNVVLGKSSESKEILKAANWDGFVFDESAFFDIDIYIKKEEGKGVQFGKPSSADAIFLNDYREQAEKLRDWYEAYKKDSEA